MYFDVEFGRCMIWCVRGILEMEGSSFFGFNFILFIDIYFRVVWVGGLGLLEVKWYLVYY